MEATAFHEWNGPSSFWDPIGWQVLVALSVTDLQRHQTSFSRSDFMDKSPEFGVGLMAVALYVFRKSESKRL